VVLPAVVLCYDVWVYRRKFSDAFAREIIPGFLCVILLLKTMSSQTSVMGGLRGHMDLNLLQILAVDATILWRYVGMLFWPHNLCVLYDPPTSGIAGMVALAVAGWTAVGLVIWKVRQSAPIVLWAAATCLLLLAPVLNFYKITTLMNDRYLYLPCLVVFGLTAAVLQQLLSAAPETSWALSRLTAALRWGVAITAVACATLATTDHLPVWQSPETLWNHAMTRVPQLPVVRIQLALTQHDRGQRREAIRTLQWALFKTEPDELDRRRMTRMINDWSAELQIRNVAHRQGKTPSQ